MIEIRLKDFVIRSSHPQANEWMANGIAELFNTNSVKNHPNGVSLAEAPLAIVMSLEDGTEIVYEVHHSPRS